MKFSKKDNFFTRLLSTRYNVVISDKPDLLFHSHDGNVHRLYRCKKVFFTVEHYKPNFEWSDYALTHCAIKDARNLRVPNYVYRTESKDLVKNENEAVDILASKTKFCAFITSYANKKTIERIQFFHKLCQYKKVDSAGRWANNIGYELPWGAQEKVDFLRPYKFYMAFENASLPYYTTEKIVDGMLARCIPIYWGNPDVVKEFNPASFINCHQFANVVDAIKRIVEIDQNDSLYFDYLKQPFFYDNKPNIYFDKQRILDFLSAAFEDCNPPVSARSVFSRVGRWAFTKRNKPHVIPNGSAC